MKNGLIIKESSFDMETTYSRLQTIINNNPNLKIILELDHSKNAASVDLELAPTKILMFGNPKLGTLLMQTSQTASIDLPQKIIVYSDSVTSSNAKIAYNDPLYLKERHTINDVDSTLETISNALNNITNKVVSD